jgi:hypothetical protein
MALRDDWECKRILSCFYLYVRRLFTRYTRVMYIHRIDLSNRLKFTDTPRLY